LDFSNEIRQALEKRAPSEAWTVSFLTDLRTNWTEAEKAITRSLGILVLLGVVFILIDRKGVTEVTLGLAKVTRLRAIEQVIPAAAAYFYYQLLLLFNEVWMFQEAYNAVYKEVSSDYFSHGLHTFLYPPNSILASGDRMSEFAEIAAGKPERLFSGAFVRPWFALVAPLLFEIYAFWVLFNNFGFRSPVVWLSVSCTVALLALGAALLRSAFA
jgi:hypothetical protein